MHALGSWTAFAFPSSKLLFPAKEVALAAAGGGAIFTEAKFIIRGTAKEIIPALDGIGKVHGIPIPKIKDLARYSKEDLVILLEELKVSVKTRIEYTARLGRDQTHRERQAAEQQLVQAIKNI